MSGHDELRRLVEGRSIIVCCGAGGVGKTTTAAAFALEAARAGRNACVVTIDPARRLANSLGVDHLANTATPISGDWPGGLHALMLDPKRTFDDLVHRYAETPEKAEAILGNRIYSNLTSSLSGTQEYMAMEKLHELVEEGGYDLVVVDTPPSRNALDFLEAPRRLNNFLSNRLFRALMLPTRAGLRMIGVAAQALLRTLSKVAGAEIVRDAVTFFQMFDGMEEGFQARADRVDQLLRAPTTAFVLVASPRADSVDEAVHFAGKLTEHGMSTTALVMNRVQPRFASAEVRAELAACAGTDPLPAVTDQIANLLGYETVADREETTYAELSAHVTPAPVVRVPLLDSDVHDLAGLALVADLLFAGAPATDDDATSRVGPEGGSELAG